MPKLFAKGVDQLVWSKTILVIVSVLLSLFIWLFLVDPVKTITFSVPVKTVSLAPDNEIVGKNLVVLTQSIPDSVEITLFGRASSLNSIKMDKFYSTIDFTNIVSPGNITLPISGPFGELKGVRVIDVSRKQIDLQIEKLNNSILQVDLRLIGEPKAGYKIITKTISPINIQLIGTEAVLKKASKAVVDINVADKDQSFTKTMYVKIIDSNGIEVKGTEKQYKTLVNIAIGKEVPVIPVLQGSPTNGFSYVQGTASVSPKTVVLSGTKEVLDGISSVYTLPLNISSLSEEKILDAEIDVPLGTKVYGRNNFVKVTVPIKGLVTRQLQVPKSLVKYINSDPANTYSVAVSSLFLTVKGPLDVVNNINELAFVPKIDVASLGIGQHTVPFEVILPKNCAYEGKHEVVINIEKIPA
ncbi:MAG: CdaR family protein [Bacillota bacterium]